MFVCFQAKIHLKLSRFCWLVSPMKTSWKTWRTLAKPLKHARWVTNFPAVFDGCLENSRHLWATRRETVNGLNGEKKKLGKIKAIVKAALPHEKCEVRLFIS